MRKAVVSLTYKSDIETLETISRIEFRFGSEIKIYSEYSLNDEKVRVYTLVGESSRIYDFETSFHQIRLSQTNLMFIS